LAPKKKIRYTRSNPDPNPPPVFENPKRIPRILKSQESQEHSASSHLDTYRPNPIQSELTSRKTPILYAIATTSSSLASTLQTILPTPTSTSHISTSILALPAVTLISANMANRYAPLQLPTNIGAMPQDYQSKITYFDGTGTYIAQQHTKKMTNYFENYEIDDDDVRMKVFVQSLIRDVRTWFRALLAKTIADPQALYQTFLNRWEKKKDPLHILSEYENLKRGPQETVQDYCTRFNNVYNAIPQNLRPPPDLALIKFPDAFDYDMAYQLRERTPQSLKDM